MDRELLTVLIVDDEEPLRQELRSFPWGDYGAELAGEAENGEEALELCGRIRPDVIVTDITMPRMDGLELVRQVREQGLPVQVILLTCHSEFGYAREALKLGALEYLVKVSLDEEDLGQALGRAREALAREQARRRSESGQRRAELSRLLVRALAGPEPGDAGTAGVPSPVGYPLSAARLLCLAGKGSRLQVLHELQEELAQLTLGRTADSRYAGVDWAPLSESELLLFLGPDAGGAAEDGREGAAALLCGLVDRLEARLERERPQTAGRVRLFALLKGPAASPEELLAAVRETERAAFHCFYEENSRVVHDGAPGKPSPAVSSPRSPAALASMEAEWREATRDPARLASYLQEVWVPWAKGSGMEPAELKRWVCRRWEESLPAPLDPEKKAAVLEGLTAAESLTGLVRLLVQSGEVTGGGRPKIRREVQQAQALIRQKLAEPITLTTIAGEVGLSPSYLSRLFREEAGEPFNEYVTRVRIDRAVELLQSAPLKVYEVAEQVGIPSYRYFSQLFRSRTGVSPTEYKRS
ncbi:response regulator [Paenibacillus mucilaginosus]|uniref:response regulator n=1 Tax=Paenibacillus mucilaginosus TaxID=61624 RepID=UPI001EEFF75D|nr:response regulator [Paenibacillus mucilaginosus]MCG7214607.1 response regulator [Paenibacillus mucilaginosus]WDM28531.1 response regulator [Paenibacillus mucilaginosus]